MYNHSGQMYMKFVTYNRKSGFHKEYRYVP